MEQAIALWPGPGEEAGRRCHLAGEEQPAGPKGWGAAPWPWPKPGYGQFNYVMGIIMLVA